MSVPVVDIGQLGVDCKSEPTNDVLQKVGKELSNAFQEYGFVFLKGLGRLQEEVKRVEKEITAFFDLPREDKRKYSHNPDDIKNEGYMALNEQRVDLSYEYELHESFDILSTKDSPFPDDKVPNFRDAATQLEGSLKKIAMRILTATALALDLKKNEFTDNHKTLMSEESNTVLRFMHYPPVPKDILEKSTRLGAHCDYGTITFIFQQDGVKGLEARLADGNWINATPTAGTVLVLVGDMFEIHSSKKFRPAEHRVVIPDDSDKNSRRSMVYFVSPDKLLQTTNPSTGEVMTVEELFKKRLSGTLKY